MPILQHILSAEIEYYTNSGWVPVPSVRWVSYHPFWMTTKTSTDPTSLACAPLAPACYVAICVTRLETLIELLDLSLSYSPSLRVAYEQDNLVRRKRFDLILFGAFDFEDSPLLVPKGFKEDEPDTVLVPFCVNIFIWQTFKDRIQSWTVF